MYVAIKFIDSHFFDRAKIDSENDTSTSGRTLIETLALLVYYVQTCLLEVQNYIRTWNQWLYLAICGLRASSMNSLIVRTVFWCVATRSRPFILKLKNAIEPI